MDSLFAKIKERLEEERKKVTKWDSNLHYIYKEGADWMGNKAIEIVNQVAEETNKGEISDGYHTFNELYHHRAILFSVICNSNKELAWKSRLHDTGDMYDGMFIVGIETPEGQATYHYDIEPYWDMFEVKKLQNAPKWDGHTPDEAIRRIGLLGKDINTSSNDGCIPLSKVAFNRMIARMESESERDIYEEESLFINVRDAARIVHEIAEEYKHGHFGCNFNGQHEKCKDCGLRGECSHYNTEWFGAKDMSDVPEINVGKNDGWIPCSSREIPKAHNEVWITYKWDDGSIHVGRDRVIHGEWHCTKREAIIAWKYMKTPAPYKPKGEK